MDILNELGLTDYEAKVYETLLKYNTATAVRVAERSQVPKAKVYDTLRQLEGKKLVAMVDKKPMTFQAIEPEIGVNALVEVQSSSLAKLGEQAIEYLATMKEEMPKIKPTEKFEILRGMEQRMILTEQFIKSSKKEYLILTAFDFKRRFRLFKERHEAVERGVVLRAITTSVNEDNEKLLKEYTEDTEVRYYKKSNLKGMSLTIKDRQESGIVITSSIDEQNIAIKISSPEFSKAMAEYFNFLWKESKSLPV